MILKGLKNRYDVGDLVGETDSYRLYLCVQEATRRQCLLQVAVNVADNGALDRAAFVLTQLKERSDELEEKFASVKDDPKDMLNYHLGFPEVLESFVCEEQGGRRITILAFREVEDVTSMEPVSKIILSARQRVDLRTSAWIMGKALKVLVLAHSMGMTAGRLDTDNIILQPKEHYVVLFDWSQAKTHTGAIPIEEARREITQAARSVIWLIGGDYQTGFFPDDPESERLAPYIKYLLNLAAGGQPNAKEAHEQFYRIVDKFWERTYYPYTTTPRD